MAETDEVLQAFNALGFAVACGRARSLEALATVFNQLGALPFTEVCASLLRLECTGDLVALAYAACDAQPARLHRRLLDERSTGELAKEVNQRAQRHEWVPGNPGVGRAKVPASGLDQNLQPSSAQGKHLNSDLDTESSCRSSTITSNGPGHCSRETVPMDLERWWWVGPWMGSVVVAWALAMWWTQRRPSRTDN